MTLIETLRQVGEPLIGAARVAKLFGVANTTIREQVRQGRMPAVKLGRQWRFDPCELAQWLELQHKENVPGVNNE